MRSACGDGFEGAGQGAGVGGFEHEFGDAFFAGGDVGLAFDEGAVVHAGGECDVDVGGGKDAAAGGEDLRRHLYGLGEVAGDVGERGDEKVAEAVAFELALLEAELEEFGEQVLVLGEGDHAVADVAGGQHVEVGAEAAGGAAVVGDGDDGGEVADDALHVRAGDAGGVWSERGGPAALPNAEALAAVDGGDVALQAAQQGGEAGASADGDDSQGSLGGMCPYQL